MRKRRCLPLRGQKRFRVARLILELSRERTGSCGALPIRNGWQARRENGKCAAIHADSVSKTPQVASPCAWACHRMRAQPPQAERIAACLPPARGADRRQLRANGTGVRHCRRALPAPAQGIHPLRIPFWGNGSRFPAAPVPNAAGGKPLRVGLPPSTPTTAPSGTKRSAQAPYSWGLGASNSSRRLLAGGTAALCRISWPFFCILR